MARRPEKEMLKIKKKVVAIMLDDPCYPMAQLEREYKVSHKPVRKWRTEMIEKIMRED